MILRGVTMADAEFLYRLRTDPVTTEASFGPPPTAETHLDWLTQTLANPERRLWIAEDNGQPVAVVRLDRLVGEEGQGAMVSITVAPEARNRGMGRKALDLAAEAAPVWGVRELLAEIKPTNVASQRCFRAASYEPNFAETLWRRALP